jgi:serine/threonine-protein kinase
VTASNPPPAAPPRPPAGPDTEPGPYPGELPSGGRPLESDLAPWSDSDVHLVSGPAVAFPKNQPQPTDEQMPTVGHIGRYALKYPIGEGGLGTVYAAHDPLLSRLIAIKTLNLELSEAERESFNQLFLNEARAAAGLSHPHIVTVYDAGVSDQGAYIAMELLKGRDLRMLRQEGWRPTHMQAALIVRRVADALAYAHSKGVIHLDIKPANIFMIGRTQPKVLDFGIARIAHQHEAFLQDDQPGLEQLIAGSPHYMAPEQVRHQAVDRRADVFSLGVVLYELLTDQKPFAGQTLTEITQAVLERDPPPANALDPTVPKPLADIAQRAMQKDPEARYRSTRSLARDLRHWLDEHAQATEPSEESAPKPAAERRTGVLGWAALAGLVLAVGSVVWLSGREAAPVAQGDARQGPVAGGFVQNAPVAAAPVPAAPGLPTPPALVSGPAAPTTTTSTADPTAARTAITGATTQAVAPRTDGDGTAPRRLASTPAAAVPPRSTPNRRDDAAAPASAPTAAGPPAARAEREPRSAEAAQRTRPPRESSRETARAAAAAAAPVAGAGAPALGEIRIAVTPWGSVEVDGADKGTTPPLNVLRLPEGRHQIVIRNADFPPYTTSVVVRPGEPITIRHRFGS